MNRIKAGDLRVPVTLLRPVRSVNEKGRPVTTWQDAAVVWASRADVSGREFYQALAYQAEDIVTLTIRARDDVTPEWRAQCHGTVYNILEVNHLGYMGDFIRLKCRAVTGEGSN